MAAMVTDLQTPQQRLERIEQSIERWRRKPASRRQRLILAGYRRAAAEVRRQVAALEDRPRPSQVVTLAPRPAETGAHTLPTPFRVFRNPEASSRAGVRRLTRTALRLVKR